MTEQPEPQRYTGHLIRRAQQLHAAAWLALVSSEITSVQYGALAVIARQPGGSQRELGDDLGLDRSTIADLARRLEHHGLVERGQDGADRRRNTLQITAMGAAELDRLRPRVEEVQRALVGTLTDDEHAELRRLLQRVLATAVGDQHPQG
ncbi:MAG: MarR family winged helix-turn-helix transcriptional regulator [Ilumatobacteraceae bacterium]